MVAQTRLNLPLNVQCLSCWLPLIISERPHWLHLELRKKCDRRWNRLLFSKHWCFNYFFVEDVLKAMFMFIIYNLQCYNQRQRNKRYTPIWHMSIKTPQLPQRIRSKFSMTVNEHLNFVRTTQPLPILTMQNAYLRKTIGTAQQKARWTNYTSQKITYGSRRHSTHIWRQ
jgi:hypothetical protein